MRFDYLLDDFRTRWAALTHPKRPPHPPRRLIDTVGGGDFTGLGQEFFKLIVDWGGLTPAERMLDIGCGCGRVAVPLMGYFDGGGYAGFDVSPKLVRWCQRAIVPRDGHFAFATLDVKNRYYNPAGKTPPHAATFPYPDASFDLAIAVSVFTHLLPDAFDRYLAESARVLKPGGRLFATFFLFNPATAEALRKKSSGLSFAHGHEFYAVEDAARPELAVCYQEEHVRKKLEAAGLRPSGPIRYGSWRNNEQDAVSSRYQDILIATKL
jgi:SAM-dependent methyltransferase